MKLSTDFRELNKCVRRKPYPIPNIQDVLLGTFGAAGHRGIFDVRVIVEEADGLYVFAFAGRHA